MSSARRNSLRTPTVMTARGLALHGSVVDDYLGRTAIGSFSEPGVMSRPLMMSATQHADLVSTTLRLHDLITRIPHLMFGGDFAQCARAAGLGPRERELILADQVLPDSQMGRADFCWDGQRPRLVEFNLGGNAGGWDIGLLAAACMRDAELQRFCRDHALTVDDPGAALTRCVRAVSPRPDPVVALVCAENTVRPGEPLFPAMIAWLAKLGFRAVAGHLGQVRCRPDGVTVGRSPVDVIYRMWGVTDLRADPGACDAHRRVAAAARAGLVGLHTPLSSELVGGKGSLALLSEAADAGRLEASDAELVSRTVPWTRRLRAGPAAGSDEPDIWAMTRERQEEFVIKPERGLGGQGVIIGSEVRPADWEAALARARHTPCVVQERVHSRPLPIGPGLRDGLNVVLGALCAGGRYAGCLVRGQSPGESGVINTGRGAREGFVLRPAGRGDRR